MTDPIVTNKYLGKDKNGYLYRSGPDCYVYQYSPSGDYVGFLCTLAAWERTYAKILLTEMP